MVYPSDVTQQDAFLVSWERLKGIAIWELDHGLHGDFLKAFLQAFLRADWSNARLLIPVMQHFVKKYHLEDRTPPEV